MRCCQTCKWYFLDKRIKDEKGKHVCFGHYLIITPFLCVDSLNEENQCDFFEKKQKDMSYKELRDEWINRGCELRKFVDI